MIYWTSSFWLFQYLKVERTHTFYQRKKRKWNLYVRSVEKFTHIFFRPFGAYKHCSANLHRYGKLPMFEEHTELKKVIEKIIGLSRFIHRFASAFCVKANWFHLSYFRYSNSAGNAWSNTFIDPNQIQSFPVSLHSTPSDPLATTNLIWQGKFWATQYIIHIIASIMFLLDTTFLIFFITLDLEYSIYTRGTT